MAEVTWKNSLTLLTDTLLSWWESFFRSIPNIVVALGVVVCFFFLGKLVKKSVERILKSVTNSPAVVGLGGTLGYLTLIGVGVFIALGILNLERTVTSLLAGAGVIGLALGFAFQEIASNFVAGVLIAFREPYRIGDIVKVNDIWGTVDQIDLRTTTIRTFDGLDVFVPNKMMFTEPLTNFTNSPLRRMNVEVGVSYSDDLDRVEKLIKSALEDTPGRCKEKEIEVYFKEFGSSSINFDVFVWIEYPGNNNYFRSRDFMIRSIKRAIEENGYTIPFPIRTLDIGASAEKAIHQMVYSERDSRSKSRSIATN